MNYLDNFLTKHMFWALLKKKHFISGLTKVLLPTLSSLGALVSSFIKASTIGLDMAKPFMAASFNGPIGPLVFSS